MAVKGWGVSSCDLTPVQSRLSFASIYLIAFLAAFNLFKAAPAIQYIASDLHIPQVMVSQIVGSYSVAALVMAFPGMWMAQKLGFKFSAMLAGCAMCLGTVLCLGADSMAAFLIGRVVEGIGYGLVAVIGPNSVHRLFPPHKVGFMMGVWSPWLPVGTVGSFFVAPLVIGLAGGPEEPFSWHAVWYLALALEIAGIAFAFAALKMPPAHDVVQAGQGNGEDKQPQPSHMRSALIVSAAFIVWTYLYVGNLNTFYPTFLQAYKGMSMGLSSLLPMVTAVISVFAGVAIGSFSAKRNCRKTIIVVGFICVAALFFFGLYTPGDDVAGPWIATIGMGLATGAVPTCTYSIIPVLAVEPRKTDFAMATMSFFMALGKVLGGALVSPTLVSIGYYANAQFVCAPLALLAAVVVLAFVKSDGKVS